MYYEIASASVLHKQFKTGKYWNNT